MRSILLLLLVAAFTGCVGPEGLKKREFYTKVDENKLKFFVPLNFKEEKVAVDTAGGVQQYYNYESGAIFYVAYNTKIIQENLKWMKDRRNRKIVPKDGIYSGTENGLHWKEVRVDQLAYGYSDVPPAMLNEFERSVNWLKLKMKKE
jgi:hypothetical protein